MLRSIRLRNFKCFEALYLPLAPITLLAGINGTGKSSVVQALLLIKQSLESGDLNAGNLLLSGELTDLGSGVNLLFEDAESDVIEIGLKNDGAEYTFHFVYDRESDRLGPQDRHYLYPSNASPFQGNFSYLCAERLGPRKVLPLSESRARKRDLGTKGEFVLHFLIEQGASTLRDADPRKREALSLRLADQVDAWLQEISPGAHLDLEAIRPADFAISGYKFDRENDIQSQRFRATNVGFGLSYVLPVIVALLAARERDLVIIENPEAHLHPKGQTRLGQLAARAAAAGAQILVETHSDHLMDGMRIDVREGRLLPSDATIHYFQRDGIKATVTTPEINRDGRLSNWPPGFFDQHDENLAKLLAPRSQ